MIESLAIRSVLLALPHLKQLVILHALEMLVIFDLHKMAIRHKDT